MITRYRESTSAYTIGKRHAEINDFTRRVESESKRKENDAKCGIS